jgi:anti-sigma factor RsiW
MNCREAIDVMDHALDDTLQPAIRAGFEEHMAECDPCRTYLEQLQITRKALRLLPRDQATIPRRGELLDEFIQESKRGRK